MDVRLIRRNAPILIVLCAILAVAIIRLRLLSVPLERDEGEYAYMAQILLRGVPPYLKAYSMKFPGIYCVYAAIMALFGQTASGIRIGLMVVNTATIAAIFFLTRRLFDRYTAALASASFAMLSIGRSVLGLSANAEHFVILFVVSGLWFLLKALGSGKISGLFTSGVLLGMAFITKQHSIFFIAFAAIYIAWHRKKAGSYGGIRSGGSMAVFIFGAAVPLVSACILLFISGAFVKFWFWTVRYAMEYVNRVPLSMGLNFFMERLGYASLSALPIWFAAAMGAGFLWRRKDDEASRVFTLLLFLFSFLAVFPGFVFRDHYFILVLPAVSILAGLAMRTVIGDALKVESSNSIRLQISVGLCAAAMLYPAINERHIFFTASPDRVSRIIYGSNPFPEAVKIAEYLKKNTPDDKSVAVLGSEPEIYFYLKRMAPTGYIYMYPLMEDQPYSFKMQEEMKSELERASPDYLVFINLEISWTDWLMPEKERRFFQWFDRYYKNHYEIIGVVNIISQNHTEYVWGDAARSYDPKTPYLIYIFKRKPV